MSNYLELQQELMLLWKSRMKNIDGLKETGRSFHFRKPVNYTLDSSQKNYQAIMADMKIQMRVMRKKMAVLQREMNEMFKMMNVKENSEANLRSNF